jgi:hypothetical protein
MPETENETKKRATAVDWLTLLVAFVTLSVSGYVALEDKATKKESNGVARGALIKDWVFVKSCG